MTEEVWGDISDEKAANQNNGEVVIPAPTQADLDWAKSLKGQSSKNLNHALVLLASENALWRVNYLMTYTHKNWRRQEQKVDVNYNGGRALFLATRKGFPSIMKVLIKNGADADDNDVCNVAFFNLKEDVIQVLWDNGIEKKQPSSVNEMISNRALESVKFLLEQYEYTDENLNEFLRYAVRQESFEIVKFLFEQYDVDVNYNDGICMERALESSDSKIANYLADKGAKILFNCDGRIQHSIEYNYLWKVELLFKMGLKADQQMVSLAERHSKKMMLELLQKNIQVSECKKNAEEYPKWEKIDQQSIAYISLMGKNSGLRMRTVFNFASRRVSEAYEMGSKIEVPSFPPVNFNDYEGGHMIAKAQEVLKEKDGDPVPYVGGKQVDKGRVFHHKKSS